MLYFRFQGHEDSNGDYQLISIDGIKAVPGVTAWVWEVDDGIGRLPINKYIPKNGLMVFFTLVPAILPDPGRL